MTFRRVFLVLTATLTAALMAFGGCNRSTSKSARPDPESVPVSPNRDVGRLVVELEVGGNREQDVDVLKKRLNFFGRSELLPHTEVDIELVGERQVRVVLPLGAGDCTGLDVNAAVERLSGLLGRRGDLRFQVASREFPVAARKLLEGAGIVSEAETPAGGTPTPARLVPGTPVDAVRKTVSELDVTALTPAVELAVETYDRWDHESGKRVEVARIWSLEPAGLGLAGHIEGALVAVHEQTNEPYVSLSFDDEGKKRFGDLTSTTVGRYLAIIFEGAIHSVPVIREPITGGRAQITLGGGGPYKELMQRAWLTAAVLQAGRLSGDTRVLKASGSCDPQ